MRLLKIWDSEYPWDVRAEKVMRTLSDAGHEVHLVARNRHRAPLEEQLPEARVHRLRSWSALGSALDAASQFPAFMNPRWIGRAHTVAKEAGVRCILVRDLPLAPTAMMVGGMLGIPVVLDMAENYPAMIRDIWTAGRQGPVDWLVRNPGLVSALERWVVRNVDHVIVVVEESGQRLVDMGVAPERVSVVCNTPWPSRIPGHLPDRSPGDGPLRLVYLGLLEKPRGVDAVLDALAILRGEGVASRLDVIGGGRDADLLRSTAADLGFSEAEIQFHGVLPYEQALSVVENAEIGVVPHLALESWNTTIPNKLFDYMSVGLPVVTSDAKPAARIVRESGCGVVCRSDDAQDFARGIRQLLDPAVRSQVGLRGRDAVLQRYNWGVDGKALLETMEGVVLGRTRAGNLTEHG